MVNFMRCLHFYKKCGNFGLGKYRLLLIQVASQQLNGEKAAPFQLIKHKQQRVVAFSLRLSK